MPWVPTRQWVVSVPIPLRYWMASSRDLTAQVHTIIRTTIAQYYINQAVSKLRHMIIPTPRQKGMDDDKLKTGTPYWHWARLLGRAFRLDMMTCPFCQQGSQRLIAAITHESVITRI